MAKLGRAAILWTSTEDANTQRVFLLDVPLNDVAAGHSMATYYAESLDRTKTATITVGNGAYELEGTVRYQSNPQGLVDVVKAGSQGKTLTYVPDLRDPAVREPVILLSPRSPADVLSDPERGFRGEGTVTLRFRRTDQAAMGTRTLGSDVLFQYRAGDSLKTATYARTGKAWYPAVTSTADYGYGTLTSAAANKVRLAWLSSRSSAGPRDLPVLLLEPSRTNLILQSYRLESTAWTKTATVTTGQADPAGGSRACLLTDSATSVANNAYTAFTVATSSYATVSWWMKQGTTADQSNVYVQTSSGGYVISANPITWSSGVPSVTWAVGTGAAPPERYRSGWYRFAGRTSGPLSTGTYNLVVVPAISASSAVGNVYVYGFQAEV